jgi:hypothetical protein
MKKITPLVRYTKLFINEDILNFYHGWVCQRPFKFHIRNRRNLSVAASTRRRRKSASTRFFSKKSLKVKIQNKFCRFFWIFLKKRHWRTSCNKNQRCIFILSVLFSLRNQDALYFMRALYFVHCWAYVIAKSKLHIEFSLNIFPITPMELGTL